LKEKAVTKNPSTELHVRLPLNRTPTHPGELFREILEEHLRLLISEAMSRMGISRQSLRAVLRGEAAVTADLVATVRALPFRSDRPFGVRRARREKIATALFRRDLTFTCHETTEQPVPQHCARALILHEKLGRPNWRIPFAGTLRRVYPRRLHLDISTRQSRVAHAFKHIVPRQLAH